jgi:2-amino-4-hydroxy-6-hydroxymethyldihydropteridine diphosphokinase
MIPSSDIPFVDMPIAYIGIGSNLGDKARNCGRALELIGLLSGGQVKKWSRWFMTRPVGAEGQEWYLNGVASLETEISARELLARLLGIESAMGRVRTKKWEPRIIDLDLLLFGEEVIESEDLQVPHPLMHVRRFVLVPMVELAPWLLHPVLRKTMEELLESLAEDGQEVISFEG